jgi:hypothetical protein
MGWDFVVFLFPFFTFFTSYLVCFGVYTWVGALVVMHPVYNYFEESQVV